MKTAFFTALLVLMCSLVIFGAGGRQAPVKNLMPATFTTIHKKTGMPLGWKIRKYGENPESVNITTHKDSAKGNIVKIEIAREASVNLDTINGAKLDSKKEYLLAVQIKIDEMYHTGHWYKRPACVRLYVYGAHEKHVWMAIYGHGSTDGWVTAICPFPAEKDKPEAVYMSRPRVYLRCYNMTGTVSFRNPVIVEKPSGINVKAFFELADGTREYDGKLKLYR